MKAPLHRLFPRCQLPLPSRWGRSEILLFVLATFSFLCTGCPHRVLVPGTLEPPPPPSSAVVSYRSTVTAASFGQATVSGWTDNGGNQPYDTSASSSGPDAPVHLTGGSTGDEQAKSCGTQGNNSQASSSATFDAQNDAVHRSYGFAITADTFAKGGFWRGKTLVFCSGSNDTQGDASASATGTIRLTYSGGLQVPDKLIVRTSSSGSPTLQILDSGGVPMQGTHLADNTIVTLPYPGPYTVVGRVSSHVNDGANGKRDHQSLTVSVQSLRDALALGYSGTVTRSFEIPLPVFVTTAAIQNELSKSLFTEDGKLYPCPPGSDCYKDAGQLYLEWPRVSTSGAWLILKVHLSGHVRGPFFTEPGVTGEVIAYGVPEVEGNLLKIDKLMLETRSSNFLFNFAAGRFRDKLTSELQAKAQYDLTNLLNRAKAKINSQFPIRWGSACLAAQLDKLRLSSVIPQSSPDGVRASFTAAISILPPSRCGAAD